MSRIPIGSSDVDRQRRAVSAITAKTTPYDRGTGAAARVLPNDAAITAAATVAALRTEVLALNKVVRAMLEDLGPPGKRVLS